MTLSLYYDTYESSVENAPELVLLHGWGLHSLVWDEVMPTLLERFQVTVIDLPGLGRSPVANVDYTLDYLIDRILAVAPKQAHWLAWSLGGVVASQIAVRSPERVQSLVTVAFTPKFTATKDWPLAVSEKVMDSFYDFLQEDHEGTLIRFLGLQCKDSLTVKEDIRKLKEILFFYGLPAKKALREGLNILRKTDCREIIKDIACPMLAIYGECDNLVPAKVADEMVNLRPETQVAVMAGVSHAPFISNAKVFTETLNEFYASLSLPVA